MTIAQRFRQYVNIKLSGFVIGFLIFAGYILVDTVTIALNPESGRITSFRCTQNFPTYSICTVRIFGLRGIAEREFVVNKSSRAYIYDVGDYTDNHTCGIKIRTGKFHEINFVYPNQHCGDASLRQTKERIDQILLEIPHAAQSEVFYNGFNRGLPMYLYKRMVMLLAGLWLALLFSILGRLWGRRKLAYPAMGKNKFFGRWLAWWGPNWLIRVFFYSYVLATFFYATELYHTGPVWKTGIEIAGFFNSCYGWEKYHGSPLGLLFGLYPLLAFATLQAFVQWRYLNREISLSAWWTVTPILTILPLVIFFGSMASLNPSDCLAFKFILSGGYTLPRFTDAILGEQALLLLFSYFLLLGLWQWFVLRKSMKSPGIWIMAPLINSLPLIGWGMLFHQLIQSGFRFDSFVTTVFAWILLQLVLLAMQDILSAVFIATLLSRNGVDKQEAVLANVS